MSHKQTDKKINSDTIKNLIRQEGALQKQGFIKQMLKQTSKIISLSVVSLLLLNTPIDMNKTNYSIYANQNKTLATQKSFKPQNKESISTLVGIIHHITNKFSTNAKMHRETKVPIGIAVYGIKLKNNYLYPYQVKTKEIEGIATINSISIVPINPAQSNNPISFNKSTYATSASLQLNVTLKVSANTTKYYWLQNVAVFNTSKQNISMNDAIFPSNNSRDIRIHRDQISLGKGHLYKQMTSPFDISNLYIYYGKQFHYSLPINLAMYIEVEKCKNGILISFIYKLEDKKQGQQPAKVFDKILLKTRNIKAYSIEVSPEIIYTNRKPDTLNAEFVWGGPIESENAVFNSMSSTLNLLYRKDNVFHRFSLLFDFGASTAETTSNLKDHFNKKGIAVITKGKMGLSFFQRK